MSNFEIYVKTSALGKTGIHWRRIESLENQPIEKPHLIQHQVIKGNNSQVAIVNDLIDEVKPSLLIFRDNNENKLLLEVTGIESPKRSDKLGRRVLNSIVWVAADSEENEEIIRKIAYSAIQSILGRDLTFSKMIEESIDFFEVEEFRVKLDQINEFIQQIEPVNHQESKDVESFCKYQIECKSTDNLEKLGEEIKNSILPKDWISWDGTTKTDGVLVVVTENLEKRTILHKVGVWRGFAHSVEEPVREIVSLPEKKTETIPSMELPEVEKPTFPLQKKRKIPLLVMLLIAVIIIILIVLTPQPLSQTGQIPQPQNLSQPTQTLEPLI